MKVFYMVSDHFVNVVIIVFNWLALGEIGKIVGIVVGISWLIKNCVDIRNKLHRKDEEKDDT